MKQATRGGVGALWMALGLLLLGCGGGGGGGGGGNAELPIDLGVFPAARFVLGQADFEASTANRGGSVDGSGMNTPMQQTAEGGLYVIDRYNHRILGYDEVPPAGKGNASFVLGQADFFSNEAGTTASTMDGPRAVSSGGGRLAVADSGNHRILIWNALPKGDAAAHVVVGQSDFTSSGTGLTAETMKTPIDVQLAGGRLFVVDAGNRRVLIWNTIPITDGVPADVVLGQPDFTSAGTGTTASSFAFPQGVWSDGVRVAVADVTNHRILIWNSIPTTNGQPADVVLGQPDFISNAPNLGPAGLNRPSDVNSNGTQFFIADSENNRVVIHDELPVSNHRPADAVVGQSDFAHGTKDDLDQDGVPDATASARTFEYPTGVLALKSTLIVTDSDNSRILIFEP